MNLVRLFLGLVAFSLSGSLFSRLSHLDPGFIAPLCSALTLMVGVAAAFQTYPQKWRMLLALVWGAGSELIGLAAGVPFGRYAYSEAWWPTVSLGGIGHFPLLLPMAWLLMAGSARLSIRSDGSAWVASLTGGLIAALADLAMEPVMTGKLGYWRWLDGGPLPGGAPIANFFGWWATATVAGLILTLGLPATRPNDARWVLGGYGVLILGLALVR